MRPFFTRPCIDVNVVYSQPNLNPYIHYIWDETMRTPHFLDKAGFSEYLTVVKKIYIA